MTLSVISRVEDELNISPETTEHCFDGMMQIYFEKEVSYNEFLETANRLNKTTPTGMSIWSCGQSEDNHLVLGVHVFPEFKQKAKETIDSVTMGESRIMGREETQRPGAKRVIINLPNQSTENTNMEYHGW